MAGKEVDHAESKTLKVAAVQTGAMRRESTACRHPLCACSYFDATNKRRQGERRWVGEWMEGWVGE